MRRSRHPAAHNVWKGFTRLLINLVVWVGIGLLAGWLASRLERRDSMGVILNAIIGCIGALVGALTLSLLTPQQAPLGIFNVNSVAVSIIGAGVFLSIARLTAAHGGARSNH